MVSAKPPHDIGCSHPIVHARRAHLKAFSIDGERHAGDTAKRAAGLNDQTSAADTRHRTMQSTAIQDLYPAEYAHCYGCGRCNPAGHHLKSYVEDDEVVATIVADKKYSGGVPGHAYGGLVASLLDCHGTASAAAFQWQADNPAGLVDVQLPRFVTGSLKVDFLKPTPLEQPLTLRASLMRIDGRKVWVKLSLSHTDVVCAAGEMLAIRLRA